MHGGWVQGHTLTHTHKLCHCASEAAAKQRGEKGPYLPEPPLRKERRINTIFLFFSFTAPSPLYTPLTPDRPIVGEDKGQGREGEVNGEESERGGADSPDKRMNDPIHCGMRRRKEEG